MPTVLITGCSSGFGLETAKLFLEKGWNVVATMRRPTPDILPVSDHLTILPLDVTDPNSIRKAFAQAGDIDVLVNNAGFGAAVPVELIEPETARTLFETNTLGTLATMQAILPGFRERRSGTIINVTSTVTLKPLPLVSVYRASKAAVNALTESLAVEMKPFDVRVQLGLDKPNHRAEATVSLSGKTLHADASAIDMYAAIDLLADKLDRLLVKHRKKTVDHHRGENPVRDGSFG